MASSRDSGDLSILNPSPARLQGPSLLHELVSTSKNSGTPAIDFLSKEDERVTVSYSELHAASDLLASHITEALASLSSEHAEEDLVVPLLIPQSPELYISLLAILKAGGAFCPLNLDAPKERIKFILKDVEAKVVLATPELASKIPETGGYKLLLVDESLLAAVDQTSSASRASRRIPKNGDLAYVMYTSGSTGTPKGVGISHDAATQSLLAHDLHIPSFQRFLQFAAPTFDVSIFEIFFPLFRGCTLVSCHRSRMLEDLPATLRTLEVDACELTPSVAGSLLKRRDNAPCLRLLLTIGEMLTEPVIHEFGGNSSQESILWGMYGPTEATIHCTLQPAFQKGASRNCIGVPLDTVSAFVLEYSADDRVSAKFNIVPLGHVGELAIGGFQLANGYFNRPKQTFAAFIESPWGRLYRTGDKAKIHLDGTIECLGRINDSQVKLNGQRIELGEIEQAILRTRGCHGAFATVLSNVLVAFAAVEDSEEYTQEQILANCKSWLPAFMIPSEIKVMRGFPQLPSGKIDRKRLVADYEASISVDKNLETQAENEIEQQLCEAGRRLLGPHITPGTRLLSAGLDSLVAIEFASILRDSGIFVSTVDILDSPTTRDLSRAIQRRSLKQHGSTNAAKLTNEPVENSEKYLPQWRSKLGALGEKIERVYTCTILQTSMIAETLKDHRLYVNQVELEVPSHATASSLKSWISLIAQRNEILRTGFLHIDNSLYQIIWKQLGDRIYIVDDFTPFDSSDAEQFLQHPLQIEIRASKGVEDKYRVRVTLHHSIYDGWTMDLIIEDLSILSSGGELIDRPQFSLASKYLTEVSEDQLMNAKEFWAEYLRGSASASTPNFKTVAVSHSDIMTDTSEIQVDPTEMKKQMLQLSFSPQVIFQACLGWLWAAVNGSDDVIIGSVSSGRTLAVAGIEKVMGPLIATLPIRVPLKGFQTIAELLQSIHTANRASLRHEVLPLPDIKRAAGLHPTTRLFDVIFVYQESLLSRRQSPNDVREVWHKDAVESGLLVEIQPVEGRYACQMTWHSNVYSQDQIQVFARHLDTLVDFVVHHLDEPLGAIARCFPIDVLSRYNEKPVCMDIHSTLSGLVEEAVALHPHQEALVFAQSIGNSLIDSQVLTFHDLNTRANRIARHIQHSNNTPGAVIAIVMEKSALMYCTILGILKAGCAYLPILPSTPIKRINLILQQAAPCLCIIDQSSSQLSITASCPIANIQDASLSGYADSNLEVRGDPSQLAYVIYTSGTTGTPKGVSVTNRNILSNIEVLSRIYPHDPSARMLQACSQGFDVSVFEIFFAWGNGMCLCSATNDTLFEDLERAIQLFGVTHLSMTVAVASLVNPCNVPNVEFLVTAGEPMTDEVLEKWADSLYQGYGPSETTNICTVRKVASGDSSQYLGWSFENTSTFVCYPGTSDLVPLGCVGELCFGGDQVAAGYLKLPEMTAAKFFNHPEYGRLYRSGDLGRMLPDGSLIILGRIDTQVKLRGLRIELQEIQSIVLGTGLARTCTSLIIASRSSNIQQLALCYVPTGHTSRKFRFLDLADSVRESRSAIQQALQDALPDYMVPSFTIPVSTLPLTSSGKVDYDRLRTSITELSDNSLSSCSCIDGQDQTEDEWSEPEKLVVGALMSVLGVDRSAITRWVPFAALGIDSISAMPLARELQNVFRTRVPLSLVIQNSSVGRLAAAILTKADSMNNTTPPRQDGLLPPSLIETIRNRFAVGGKIISAVLPCTPLQEAMLASSSSEASASYFNQMLFKLRTPAQTMFKYWDTMFRRHEILRTCFVTTDEIKFPIVQLVLETSHLTYKIFEAGDAPLHREAARHSKSLPRIVDSGEPPVSLAVFRSGSAEYLSFVCHHAVYDGISIRNLLSEIEALAHNEQLSTPLRFETFLQEALTLPYDVDEFWAQHLQGFRPPRLDRVPVKEGTGPIEIITQASSRSLSMIEGQLRDMSVSLLSFCQAVWAITISLLQNNNDVCFGNVVSGRSIAVDNIDALVAPCFNTLPFRMDLTKLRTTLELVKTFHSLNVEMLPYQFTGLRRIQSQLQISQLFDTLLILQPQSKPLDDTIWALERDYGAMDLPIVCELTPSKGEDTLHLKLHRHSSVFSHQTSLFVRDIFQRVFDDCLDHPSSHFLSPSELPLEWQSQIDQLSTASSGTDTPITIPEPLEGDASWTKEETIVRSTLSKLANIPQDRVERHMPIYRFGLDSIGAVQLSAALRREGHAIPASDIMANPTISGIASHVKVRTEDDDIPVYDFEGFRQSVSRDIASSPVSSPEKLEEVLPCSPVQQGMLSQFLMSEGKHYFNFSSWIINADVDTNRLVQAWDQLVARHQILRAGFVSVNHPDSSFAMVIYPTEATPIPVTKQHDIHLRFQRWRAESAQQALRALHQPPWRVVLEGDAARQPTMHLAMHHALYDAYSLRELLHELADLLAEGNMRSRTSIKPALSQIFSSTTPLQDPEEFWKPQAENLIVNSFPTLTPLRVEKQSFSSVSRSCHMSSDRARQCAAEASITIQAALQGAWTRLLSAYHGEASVTFGVVLDGRSTEDSRLAIFPMISTLPVLARNVESNQELLNSMLQYNASIRRYEHTPLANIQRWLGRPDGSLFDTIIVYQVADLEKNRLPWTVLDEAASVDYAVSLEIEERSDKLQFNLTFDTSILPSEQASIMLEQLDFIFIDLIAHPNCNATKLAIEAPNLCSILPPAHQELPCSVRLLHQLVEQTAILQPGALALEFVDELDDHTSYRRWTYREIDEMGNKVANLLYYHHRPIRSIVAICFDKCPEAYFSILGILKAGCAFLALDPSAPSSRQEFILRDSNATCLLIAEGSSIEFTSPAPVIEVGAKPLSSMRTTLPSLPQEISPSDTCYCLYTSGTTGTPKGCLISHDNTVQAMLAFKELFSGHWDAQSRWLQFASFHFDVSVLEQYWSWLVGITVVAAPRDLILNDLIKTISKLEITHIDLTPSLARLTHPDEVPSLCKGVFITGGEQLRQDVLDNWGPKEVIYNAYGPTEATIGVTMFQRVPANGRSSNIGRAFPNVGLYVFQPGTETPVLRGAVGELCVSGRLVGKGYLNRPELTEERFPILKQYGERVYRTGDLVRVLYDDTIDFLGRADDQVKLRGQRLEIGEINHAIKAGVSEVADVATLVARLRGQDRDLLISFISPSRAPASIEELSILSDQVSLSMANMAQDACRGRLPVYMVPTYVFVVPFIPLSANNKANLSSLKELFSTLSHEQLRNLSLGTTGVDRGLNNRERQIASVLSTITSVEITDIKPSSTIFELGIDSITVTRVARNLHKAGFASATPSLILKNPQISRLAQILGQEKASTIASRVLQVKQSIRASHQKYLGLVCRTLGVSKGDVEYIAPCTPLQEGMLTRTRTTGDHSAYFNHFRISLHSSTSVDRLKGAWASIAESCSILRTSFVQTPDGYVQVALKGQSLRWFESHVDDESIQGYLENRHREWVESNRDVLRYPFELDYAKGPSEHVLSLRLFHALYDANSFELILRTVFDENHGNSKPYRPSFLDVLPYGPLLPHSESRPFWEALFKGHTFQPMPQLANAASSADTSVSRIINVHNLEARRIMLGVTHQTILQAAWLAVIHQYFTTPPTIGIVFSGRSIVFDGVESVIGPMFNTLPFQVETFDMPTWRSLVRKTHEYNTSVLDFVHTPLRDIQKWCSRGQQLFDLLFTFDREDPVRAKGADVWSSITSTAVADYPLALEVVLTREGSLRATVVAQAGIADEEILNILLDKLQQALKSLAESDNDTVVPNRRQSGLSTSHPRTIPNSTPASSSSHRTTSAFEWTDLARKLRREIAQLAGLAEDEVSETTSIFELGLDSIDAIKLAARSSKIGVRVTTSDLMRRATIESILSSSDTAQTQVNSVNNTDDALAKSVSQLERHLKEKGVDLEDVEAILPPTPLQDSMVTDMILSGFHRYFNHDVLEFSPGTDLSRLKYAWVTVYANSPILRTSFMEVDDPSIPTAFCQLVRKGSLQFGPTIQLTSLSDVQKIIDKTRQKVQETNGSSALFQLNFVATATSQYVVLSISHALYDGWSLDMLYRDVRAAYDGHYQARKPYDPYLSRILFSFGTASHNFWADYMSDVHPTILQYKGDVPETQSPLVHRAEVTSRLTPKDLKALCRRYGVTPQVLSQGCWAAVLATLSHSLDVTFGIVLSGRDTDEAQQLLFPTMNTVPVRIILHGTVAEYMHSLQATMSEVLEFQHMPLRQIQRLADTNGQNLFNTLFILQNRGEHEHEERSIMESVQGSSAVEYPICIEMELSDESILWRIACDDHFGSSDEATRILCDLETVLRYFANNQDAEVVQFSPSADEVRICGMDSFSLEYEHQLEIDTSVKISPDHNDRWTSIDSPILDVLAQLSGVEKTAINPDDSIYHLGLDSISAMKASSMLRKIGLNISVGDMLRAASIRQLVGYTSVPDEGPKETRTRRIDLALKDINLSSLLDDAAIDPDGIEDVLAALPMQAHMLTVWQNTRGLLFFPTFTYKITGTITSKCVAEAWKTLLNEIPILRTSFIATGSSSTPFIQVVRQTSSIIKAGTRNPEDDGHGGWSFQEVFTPFVSMAVEGSKPREAYMYLRIHHALYDGVSLPFIMNRFAELCNADPPASAPDSLDAWHKFVLEHSSSDVKSKARKFWTSYLEGAPSLDLLSDSSSIDNAVQQVSILEKDVISDIGRLKRLTSSHGVTLQSLFFAAYAKVLGSHHGRERTKAIDDVVFGIYMANRMNVPGLEEAPYPTLSILPLMVRGSASKGLLELAAEIQRGLQEISTTENSSAGLWEIYQWTGVKIDTFVNFLSLQDSSEASGSVSLEQVSADSSPMKLDNQVRSHLATPDEGWISKNQVRDCYVDAVDVEVAVRGESMDIGVFSTCYSEAKAKVMIERIVRALGELA